MEVIDDRKFGFFIEGEDLIWRGDLRGAITYAMDHYDYNHKEGRISFCDENGEEGRKIVSVKEGVNGVNGVNIEDKAFRCVLDDDRGKVGSLLDVLDFAVFNAKDLYISRITRMAGNVLFNDSGTPQLWGDGHPYV